MYLKFCHSLVVYLFAIVVIASLVPPGLCGEYHYPSYESKQYEVHEYHPPPKKSAHVDINIPIDFGTIAKLGLIGLTQLKLLNALGKVAGAGLGVGALGLSHLGKIALSVGPAKGGIQIDLGGKHHAKSIEIHEPHHHYAVDKRQYEPPKRYAPETSHSYSHGHRY